MNQWPFIIAAYALAALGTLGLSLGSWRAMRAAEARAAALGNPRRRKGDA